MPTPPSLASIPLSANIHAITAWGLPQGNAYSPAGVPLIQPSVIVSSGRSTDLSLSMSLSPVPARIVQQVRSGQLVDMRDLLGANAAVRQHFEGVHGALGFHVFPMYSRQKVWEVTALPSWITCFLTYLAVLIPDPVTCECLAYAILVVQEAMHHGGQDWLDYDWLFQQQAVIDSNLQWNLVHPGLQATTISSHRSGLDTFYNLCQECDHTMQQCAMTQLQQPSARNNQTTMAPRTTPRHMLCVPRVMYLPPIFAPGASNHHTLHEIASLPLGLGKIRSLLVPPPQHPVELLASFKMTLHFTSLCLPNWLDNLVCVILLSIVLLLCCLFVLCVHVLVMSNGIIIKLLYMIHWFVLGCFPLVGILICWLLFHNWYTI